ncbi:MAG: cob(I)yrinic acid a,c-diamide adenosyltransferase [Alphaproteobacteria bacterium]
MVRLNKIYTRTGDDGTSGLAGGERRAKTDPRFAAIGAIDEVNALLGVARSIAAATGAALTQTLGHIQNDLFDLGADLATPGHDTDRESLRVNARQVGALEAEIDRLNASLAPLNSFVLPGGTPLAAALHHARTVARRAERDLLSLSAAEPLNPEALRYANRLSDFLFVAARHANDDGAADVLWEPGKHR